MEKLINYLLEEKETMRGTAKESIVAYNLTLKDYRMKAIYKSVNNALISIDSATKEKDDIIQEIFLGLWKYTPVFLENEGITADELLTAAKDTNNNEMAAKFFGYIKIKIVGMVKSKYHVTNDEEKQLIDEVFFLDLVTNGEVNKAGEEAIADYLTSNNITAGKDTSFKEWLIRNGQDILTKNQMDYLENRIGENYKDDFSYRERISDRILKKYGELEYNNKYIKKLEYVDAINILEDILNSKNFYWKLREHKDEDVLIDFLTGKHFNNKFLSLQESKELTALLNEEIEELNIDFLIKILITMDIYKNKLIFKLKNRD